MDGLITAALSQVEALLSIVSTGTGSRPPQNSTETGACGVSAPAAPVRVDDTEAGSRHSEVKEATTSVGKLALQEPDEAPASEPASVPFPAGKKKKKEKTGAPPPPVLTLEDIFTRAWLQVGLVQTVEEIDSDKLYKLQINIGGGETRQVIAGLKKHVAKQTLEGSLVVLILNLKPAKLAGHASEAMVLAGVAPLPDGGELVHPICPPEGSEPGDRVFLEGSNPASDLPKVLKSDQWRDIKAALHVVNSEARLAETRLVTSHGVVKLPPDLPDGAQIS